MKKQIICECGVPAKAKGLCRNCYQRNFYRKRSKEIKKYGNRGKVLNALARDGFTCQRCLRKATRRNLAVVKRNGIKTDFSPNNLMTLCRRCTPNFFKEQKIVKMRKEAEKQERRVNKTNK